MKIQLGAIVTSMAGSIGGQTVRRWRGGFIMQNKTSFSRNLKVYENKALITITNAFRGWRPLSSDTKAQWNTVATLYQFPDKFGQLRYLTGRQLYTMLTINCQQAGLAAPNPFALDAVVYANEYSATVIDVTASLFTVELSGIGGVVYFTISVCRLQAVTDVVSIERAKFITAVATDETITPNIFEAVENAFGTISIGDAFMIVVRPYSFSGFLGLPMVERWVATE